MKIHKLSNVIVVPFAIAGTYLLYHTLMVDETRYIFTIGGEGSILSERPRDLPYAIIPIILVALIYMFKPQINYWWINKFPPDLDSRLLQMLSDTNPIYRSMTQDEKKEFQKRLTLYTEGNEFIAKGMDNDHEVPYDVKNMVSQIPITMMWNKKDKRLKSFERIVMYKHPFGSPKYQFLHTAETNVEDGVIIFCLEHTEKGFKYPDQYYNVAWHAYSEAFIKTYPNAPYPTIGNDIWSKIHNISGFPEEGLKGTLGYNSIDPLTVIITLAFTHKSAFQSKEKDLYRSLESLFA